MELQVVSRKSVVKNELAIIEINTANTHFKGNGGIDLWSPFNLFADANKSSYIDSFVGRSMDCERFIHALYDGIIEGKQNWYLWK